MTAWEYMSYIEDVLDTAKAELPREEYAHIIDFLARTVELEAPHAAPGDWFCADGEHKNNND